MREQSRTHKLTFVAASFALASASCIADDADPLAATIPADGELTIVMNEFVFEPSSITVVAGSTVTVTLVNEGLTPHEFMVGRDSPEGGGYSDDLLGQMLMAADGHGFVRTALAQDHVDDDHPDHEHPDDTTTDDGSDSSTEPDPDARPPEHHGDEADEHPADEHPADEHPPDEHPPDEHPPDEHPPDEADEHPADEHHGDEADGHTSGGHGDAEHAHQGSAITVEAGGEATLVFMIPADATGSWEVGCFIEGHYEAGMYGTLTVNPPVT